MTKESLEAAKGRLARVFIRPGTALKVWVGKIPFVNRSHRLLNLFQWLFVIVIGTLFGASCNNEGSELVGKWRQGSTEMEIYANHNLTVDGIGGTWEILKPGTVRLSLNGLMGKVSFDTEYKLTGDHLSWKNFGNKHPYTRVK